MSEKKTPIFILPGHELEIVRGDITQERVDAVVNAANEYLAHGGGVAAAIVRKGGHTIQQESARWVQKHGPVQHAHPAYTSGGNLPCRYVIHAVGPRWGEGEEDEKLMAAVEGSLKLADELQLNSIAFPAISTGIFGFPTERAAKIIIDTIWSYVRTYTKTGLSLIRVTLFDENTFDIFNSLLLQKQQSEK